MLANTEGGERPLTFYASLWLCPLNQYRLYDNVRNTSTIFFHLVFIIYIKSLFSSPAVRYTDTLLGKVTICIFCSQFGIKISYIYSQHITHTPHPTPQTKSPHPMYLSSKYIQQRCGKECCIEPAANREVISV